MMRRLPALLRRLYRALNPDPAAYVAMRISHPAGGEWAVRDTTLTLHPFGNPRPPAVTLDLAPPLTLAGLASLIADAGWQVDDLTPENRARGAIALLEVAEATTTAAMMAHDSLLWAIMDALAVELDAAAREADDAPRQMVTTTATGEWLDELGAYYGAPRLPGEADAVYGPRIAQEVLRPKSNNLAMASVIQAVTGQPTIVRDVTVYGDTVPIHDASIDYDGAYTHDAESRAIYGLFDVETSFDLLGSGDLSAFQAAIIAQVERLRAAGTQLRQLNIGSGNIPEPADMPTDAALTAEPMTATPLLDDDAPAPLDEAAALIAAGLISIETAAPTPADDVASTAGVTVTDDAIGPATEAVAATSILADAPDAAPGPGDTDMVPAGQVDMTEAADTPAQDLAADATLEAMDEPAAGGGDTDMPTTAVVAATETATNPTEGTPPLNGSLAALSEAAPGGAEAAETVQNWTHLLDGAWNLDGLRPLSSGAALTEAL